MRGFRLRQAEVETLGFLTLTERRELVGSRRLKDGIIECQSILRQEGGNHPCRRRARRFFLMREGVWKGMYALCNPCAQVFDRRHGRNSEEIPRMAWKAATVLET